MLALVAKVAVLYVQNQPDPVIVDAVSDVERLTANLTLQIWQKITLIHSVSSGMSTADAAIAQPASKDGDEDN